MATVQGCAACCSLLGADALETAGHGGGFLAPMALSALPADKQPSACIGCRSCEAVCPQQIKISEALADFAGMLKD